MQVILKTKVIQLCLIGLTMAFGMESKSNRGPIHQLDFIEAQHKQLIHLSNELNERFNEDKNKFHQLIQYAYDEQWNLTEKQMNNLIRILDLFSFQDFSNGESSFFKKFTKIGSLIKFFQHPLGFRINYNCSKNTFELYGNGFSNENKEEHNRIILFLELCNKYKDHKQQYKNIMETAIILFNNGLNDNKGLLFVKAKTLIEAKPWRKIIDINQKINLTMIFQGDQYNKDIINLIYLACLPGEQKETTIAMVKNNIKNETIQKFFHRICIRYLVLIEKSLGNTQSFNRQAIQNNILFAMVKGLENPSHDHIDSLLNILNICGFNGNLSPKKLKELWDSCFYIFLLRFYFAINCNFKI
jgi:hypothetical protein